MRILSTGDFHIGAGYDQDIADSVCQITRECVSTRPDVICITGDVFHAKSDPGQRNVADYLIRGLASVSPVFIIKGNHDAPGDLLGFANLESSHPIKVLEYPSTMIWASPPFTGNVMHFLPWITKSNWQSLHPEASTEEGDRTVSQMVLTYLKNQVLLYPGSKHILIGHALIAGARAQNHQPLMGEGVTLGVYDLPDAGFYAGLLGHIHLKQEFAPRFLYNGSVAALNYGEEPEKFYSVLDTDTGEVEWYKLKTVDRFTSDADWIQDQDGRSLFFQVELDENRVKGARVRINIRVQQGDDIEAARTAAENKLLALGALECKVNVATTPKEVVRAHEIHLAVTMADKLKRYWEATTPPAEDAQKDMISKLADLEETCNLNG